MKKTPREADGSRKLLNKYRNFWRSHDAGEKFDVAVALEEVIPLLCKYEEEIEKLKEEKKKVLGEPK